MISWWLKHNAPIVSSPISNSIKVDSISVPDKNTLIIPKIGVTQDILEGDSVTTVDKGPWRRPASSTPDNGSNTVIAGHRFSYSGGGVFYNLDKVSLGDQIIMFWDGKIYEYRVTDKLEVTPEQVSIEAPTNESVLTLYTCAPLLTAKNRLVIRARLASEL